MLKLILMTVIGLIQALSANQARFGIFPAEGAPNDNLYLDFELSPINFIEEEWYEVGDTGWLIPSELKDKLNSKYTLKPVYIRKGPYIKYRLCTYDRDHKEGVPWVTYEWLEKTRDRLVEVEVQNGKPTGIECQLILGDRFIFVPPDAAMDAIAQSDEMMAPFIYLGYGFLLSPLGRNAQVGARGLKSLQGFSWQAAKKKAAETGKGAVVYGVALEGSQFVINEHIRNPDALTTTMADVFSLAYNAAGEFSNYGGPIVSLTDMDVFRAAAGFDWMGILLLPEDQNIVDFAKKLKRMLGGDKKYQQVQQRWAIRTCSSSSYANCGDHYDAYYQQGPSAPEHWLSKSASPHTLNLWLLR